MAALNYASAGVNRVAADRLVEKIAILAKSTLNKKVKASIGGYASLYEFDKKRWLAASTDGVGTKLKLAFELRKHDTIGIDLVAMSVNDLLCVGATPLFFLDYFATGKLLSGVAEQVLKGIVAGCEQAGCALVGGETAEMPDFYHEGEYDLGGFVVGEVAPKKVLPAQTIKPVDLLIGIQSSGCHSTGYSLLRKLLARESRNRSSLMRELLTPTRIYAKSLLPLISKGEFKALAHITGSGFLNVPRMSDRVSYELHLPTFKDRPKIYQWVREASDLSLKELSQTFNLGVGMVAAVAKGRAKTVLKSLERSGESAWILGEVKKRRPGRSSEVHVYDFHAGTDSATLSY